MFHGRLDVLVLDTGPNGDLADERAVAALVAEGNHLFILVRRAVMAMTGLASGDGQAVPGQASWLERIVNMTPVRSSHISPNLLNHMNLNRLLLHPANFNPADNLAILNILVPKQPIQHCSAGDQLG